MDKIWTLNGPRFATALGKPSICKRYYHQIKVVKMTGTSFLIIQGFIRDLISFLSSAHVENTSVRKKRTSIELHVMTSHTIALANLYSFIFEVKLTLEMLTVHGQQHSFSTHERVFLRKCQSFETENVSTRMRRTRTPNLRIHAVCYDDVIKWKHFPRNWPFVRGIHRDAELWCFLWSASE